MMNWDNTTIYQANGPRPTLLEYSRQVLDNRRFIWQLAKADLRATHHGTKLGRVWLFLEPLLLALVYYIVRSVLQVVSLRRSSDILAHIIWAIFVFYYVRWSVVRGSSSIVGAESLILTAHFPRAVLPLATVARTTAELGFMIPVYSAFHLALGQPAQPSLLSVPLVLAPLVVLASGFAMFFATVAVVVRDLRPAIPYFARIWLYLTPVLYLVAEIPEHLQLYLKINPLYPFFAALEQALGGRWPSLCYLLAAFAWAVASLAIGAATLISRERDLAIKL